MKKILIFLSLIGVLLSNDLKNNESSVFDKQETTQKNIDNDISIKNLYLSYLSYPKHIYKNQRFEIEVKALITRNDFDKIETFFVNGENMPALNPSSPWQKDEQTTQTYINKYHFKAYNQDFSMPTLEVNLYKDDILIETRRILPKPVSFSEIGKNDERFSSIIAKNLKVTMSKAKQYTNKEALVIIDMRATNSNLEEFHIKGVEEQGIALIEDNYLEQHIIYYLIIPAHKKSIIFDYYNLSTNNFKDIVVPITFEEELVSTQTDLNPNNSSFEFYKKMAVGLICIIFFISFIWKRRFIFLVLALFFLILFIIFVMPNKVIKLKENTVIHILPTKNSTIFEKTGKIVSVEDMKRKNGFVKIMFRADKKKLIGWVKEQDVIKN